MRLAEFTSNEVSYSDSEEQDSWESKHRPRSLSELALNESLRRDLEAYVEDGSLPNLILHGPAGRGKTTTAHVLANEFGYPFHERNASLEGTKDDIAELDRRLKTMVDPYGTVLLFEEADGLSSGNRSSIDSQTGAQEALKRVMEKWDYVSFVFTTNHLDKLIDPIKSRCKVHDFSQIPVEERARRLQEIAQAEELEAEEGALRALARRKPDMRAAIQEMQDAARQNRTLTKRSPVTTTLSSAFFTLGDALSRTEDRDGYPYRWRPYTARGFLTLVAGPPKVSGKSTLARHLAAAHARGQDFLGQQVGPGRVLWVGPDEYWVHTARDLKALEVPEDRLILWTQDQGGTGVPGVPEIAEQAQRTAVDLVVLDTLPRVAGQIAENDNSAWTHWSEKALPHIRESDAAWLAIHHTRKGDESSAAAIRGASQILGMVDVGITLSKTEGRKRQLKVVGTRLEQPPVRTIELQDEGYRLVSEDTEGSDASGSQAERRAAIRKYVKATPGVTREEVYEAIDEDGRFDVSETTVYRDLRELVEDDDAPIDVEGLGRKGDPYRYHPVG